MKYKHLGINGPLVSLLGFGCSRLTDYNESEKAIKYAINNGINLFETGPGYRNSEIIVGNSIKDNRDKVYISTKCSLTDENNIPITQDMLFQKVEISLKRLKTDKIDIFNIWNIRNPYDFISARKKYGFIDGVRKLMKEGIINYFGFSSHDSPENIKIYIDSGEFDVAIISYSIIDTSYETVINYAKNKGLGVIAMKPLYGGVVSLMNKIKATESLEATGLKFVMSLPSITSVIPGMTNLNEVIANINSINDIENIRKSRESILKKYKSSYLFNCKLCSGCRYCDSCPVGIPIPKLMKFYNILKIFKKENSIKKNLITIESSDFDKCTKCKSCEEKCPENLNIVERLKELHDLVK